MAGLFCILPPCLLASHESVPSIPAWVCRLDAGSSLRADVPDTLLRLLVRR